MPFFLLTLFTLFSFAVSAIELDVSGKYSARYRYETSKNRGQQRVVLKFVVQLNGDIELVAVGTNGSSFNSSYDSFYNSSNEDKFDGGKDVINNFAPRNFYFQRQLEAGLTLQIGAIPIEKRLTSITALDSNGWIDGLRIKNKTSYGELSITAGSLTDPDEIDAFERKHELNYFEVSLKKEIFDDILMEIGLEKHNDNYFLTLAHKQQIALASDKIITFVSEALINIDENVLKTSAGIKGDFIHILTHRRSGVTFDLRSNYSDVNIGDRGTSYTSGFKTSAGHYGTVTANFYIHKKNKVTGYCRYKKNYDSEIDDERLECGITKKN